MKIAVIGCGLAGAAAALALHKHGHSVEIYERSPELGTLGAGILLQEPGLQVLKNLGLEEEVLARGARITRLAGFTPGGKQILDLPYQVAGNEAFGLGIHRGVLFSLLHGAVSRLEIPVTAGAAVREVVPGTSQAVLYFEDGRSPEPFDFAVIADGAHARTQSGAWRKGPRQSGPWGAWWTSLPAGELPMPNTLHQVFDGPDKLLGILPTGEIPGTGRRGVSLFWGTAVLGAEAWRARGLGACRRDMLALEPRLASVLDLLPDTSQWVLARYYDHLPRHFSDGRSVAAIGDGAHAMGPHLGQGANLGLQDAWALAENLRPKGLRRYERGRRRHAFIYHRFSKVAGPFFQSHSRLLAAFRNVAMPWACAIPWAQGRMVKVLRGHMKKWVDLFL